MVVNFYFYLKNSRIYILSNFTIAGGFAISNNINDDRQIMPPLGSGTAAAACVRKLLQCYDLINIKHHRPSRLQAFIPPSYTGPF